MKVVILKYNAGNIYSVDYALKRIGVTATITDDIACIQAADKVIFPGVGEAATTMDFLNKSQLGECLCSLKQPVLGICLGMQLLCKHSEEGNAKGLGIFDLSVKKFIPSNHEQKIPHMGWNTLKKVKSPLFKNIPQDSFVYFVHSFYVPQNENCIAETNYIHDFCAALHKDNFYATQFHPEKSGKVGEQILQNFLDL
jgi:glutamine amidotransferase